MILEGWKWNSKGEVNEKIDRKINAIITIITYFYILKAKWAKFSQGFKVGKDKLLASDIV